MLSRPRELAAQRVGLYSFFLLITPQRFRKTGVGHSDCGAADMPRALMPHGSSAAAALTRALSAVVAGLSFVLDTELDTEESSFVQFYTLRALDMVGVAEHAQMPVAAGFPQAAVAATGRDDLSTSVRTVWLDAVRQVAADAGACAALVAAGAREAVQRAAADAATAGIDGGSDEELAAVAAAAAEALQQPA
jgi:hypothetical protein